MTKPSKAEVLGILDQRVTAVWDERDAVPLDPQWADELAWLLLTRVDIVRGPEDADTLRRYHNILTKGG